MSLFEWWIVWQIMYDNRACYFPPENSPMVLHLTWSKSLSSGTNPLHCLSDRIWRPHSCTHCAHSHLGAFAVAVTLPGVIAGREWSRGESKEKALQLFSWNFPKRERKSGKYERWDCTGKLSQFRKDLGTLVRTIMISLRGHWSTVNRVVIF